MTDRNPRPSGRGGRQGEGSKTVDVIVAETGLRPNAVSSIIARLAENDRKQARDLLDAWEAPAQPPVEQEPVPVPVAVPAPEPEPAGDAIADVISRAVATEVPKLVRAADKISDLVDQLEKELATHERTAALRVEQEKLAARLAVIQQELGVKHAAASPDDGKVIRAWAAKNGVTCPARGRVPAVVRERYQAAMDSETKPSLDQSMGEPK